MRRIVNAPHLLRRRCGEFGEQTQQTDLFTAVYSTMQSICIVLFVWSQL